MEDTEEIIRFNRENADLDSTTRKQVNTLSINGFTMGLKKA